MDDRHLLIELLISLEGHHLRIVNRHGDVLVGRLVTIDASAESITLSVDGKRRKEKIDHIDGIMWTSEVLF